MEIKVSIQSCAMNDHKTRICCVQVREIGIRNGPVSHNLLIFAAIIKLILK